MDTPLRPLFIGGYPKSGTTLMLSLLDCHPELIVFPEETGFLGGILPFIRSGVAPSVVLDYVCEETGVKWLAEDEPLDKAGRRDYSAIDFDDCRRTVASSWAESGYSERGLMEAIVGGLASVTGQTTAEKKFWVEKSPGNEHYMADIRRLFPEALFVGCVRDPRANYFAYRTKKQRFFDIDLPIGSFLLGWLDSVCAIAAGQDVLTDTRRGGQRRAFAVIYEDLVAAPCTVMEGLAAAIGIEWNDCLLQPTRLGKPWEGNSMHGLVFDGISAEARDLWKSGLDTADIALIETLLGEPFLAAMGWEKTVRGRDRLRALWQVARGDGLSARQRVALALRLWQLRADRFRLAARLARARVSAASMGGIFSAGERHGT